jgi:hypothetical protein
MPEKDINDAVINRSTVGQSSVGSIILNVDKGEKEPLRACSFCHNQISERNISLVCEECDSKFCVLCEASFRRGIHRRTGEPALCRKCYKLSEEAKANGIKESWKTSLEKREAELKDKEQMVAAEHERYRIYANGKQQELASREQELARRGGERRIPARTSSTSGALQAISLITGSAGITMLLIDVLIMSFWPVVSWNDFTAPTMIVGIISLCAAVTSYGWMKIFYH